MGRHEKVEHTADHDFTKLGGKAEETIGRATGDEELEARGDRDQTKSNLEQARDKVEDAFRR